MPVFAARKGRTVALSIGLAGLGLCLAGYLAIFAPDRVVYWREIRRGNDAVRLLDSYRKKQGRLPASLEEVGIADADSFRLSYQKCSDRQFVLWFGTRLGKSMTYDPQTGGWVSLNRLCE